MSEAMPRVSIVIPAYNVAFFGEALASALAQSERDIEVVVCDDSPGEEIGRLVERAADARVRYLRNAKNLGFGANFTRCFHEARADLVKFLNDDDRLHPRCVERLAGALERFPQAALATSRRAVVDAAGKPVAGNVLAATPVSHVSGLLEGRDLGDFVLANSENFIGEPSTVLFRKSALALEDGVLFRWGGRDFHCTADLSVWLRLLAKAPAWYDANLLSDYRYHAGQEQYKKGVRAGCMTERLELLRLARGAGFLAAPGLYETALRSLRTRAAPWASWKDLDEGERGAIAALLAAIDGELAASGKR